MHRATDSKHPDWLISTVVGFNNPADWKPGDLDRFCVRGIAPLPLGDARGTYTTEEALVVTTNHFTDERLALRYHGEATAKLQQIINKLRVE